MYIHSSHYRQLLNKARGAPTMTHSIQTLSKFAVSAVSALSGVVLLAACSSTPMSPAPVVERSINGVAAPSNSNPTSTTSGTPVGRAMGAGGATNSGAVVLPRTVTTNTPAAIIDGKAHIVKKGDTLFSIALENGVGYRELAEWNGITNPSYIQIDQVLRLSAPNAATVVGNAAGNAGGGAQSSPISLPSGGVVTSNRAATTMAVASPPTVNSPVVTEGDLAWQWPVRGKATSYVEGKSKGVDISGNMGDAIVAAADGKVVYAGSALKGYGQMLIIKHSEVYLTAYAHNSKLLVREEQLIKRGQKIAEMGNSESDNGQVKLHFELRRSGKPVDPTRILPPQ